MSIHATTVEILENPDLVQKVVKALKNDYSRRYIERKYNVTRRQIDNIKRITNVK